MNILITQYILIQTYMMFIYVCGKKIAKFNIWLCSSVSHSDKD